ncbi:hypothetical protein [Bacillus mycoides]|uniref:hypothetical protein n=1 Tax=Bacillus mycoides TaxID=1405 RepID=UPI001C0205CB|nr:hypothetical protein [Bacillus mycoides]QWI48290.1 hypothetical protein EXW56_04850 [Bacillus mycoides]
MRPIDIKKVEEFKKSFQAKKKKGGLLEYIKLEYETKGMEFHRLFLHSGCALGMSLGDLNLLLEKLNSLNLEIYSLIAKDIEFAIYLNERIKGCNNIIKVAYLNSNKKIYIEDLFSYLEYVNFNMRNSGIGIDDKTYESEILNSQYNHLLDSFPGIIEFIKEYGIKARLKEPKRINKECKTIFQVIATKYSLRNFFLSLSTELIKPEKLENYKVKNIDVGKVFFLRHNVPYWSSLERYRDLNFTYQQDHIIDSQEMFDIMKKTKSIKSYSGGEILHMDLSKENIWKADTDIWSAFKLLVPIYGDEWVKFSVKNYEVEYVINDLLTVYKAIYKLALDIEDNMGMDTGNFIKIYGEKQLIRYLGLEQSHKILLQFLSYDLNAKQENTSFLVRYKPLMRRGDIYYIIPAWIQCVAPQKAIDKILSSDEIQLQLNDKTNKGYVFEKSIELFFNKINICFNKLDRDEANGLPEIDGMFVLGEYIFIFDAKATIKPENLIEVYNNLQGHLYKAYNQLVERLNVLISSKKNQDLIKEKTGIDVSGKRIVPFILLNHHYFNGYRELKINGGDQEYHIPIIDFFTLKQVMEFRKIPVWEYNEKSESYYRSEIPFENFQSGMELSLYLSQQIKGMLSEEKPAYQLTEEGILFKIVKPFKYKAK